MYTLRATAPFEGAKEGMCHVTGNLCNVTADTKNFKFKYYVTNKLGFSRNFAALEQGGFYHAFTLGEEAYKRLLVGERFIMREMRLRGMGRTSVYLIPDFHRSPVNDLSETLVDNLYSVKDWATKKLKVVEEEFEEQLAENPESTYLLNFLFYQDDGKSFKISCLIQDVPMTRLTKLANAGIKAGDFGQEVFTKNGSWKISLDSMYYLIPTRKQKEQRILTLYESLFTNLPINPKILAKDFVELIYLFRFPKLLEIGSYQIRDPRKSPTRNPAKPDHSVLDEELVRFIARSQLLLYLIRQLDQLEEESMDDSQWIDELKIRETQKTYIREMHFNQQKASLFLLGTLIGSVSNAQYRRGEGGQGGKKTILNKLNYQGMGFSKVQRLVTDLFEKLTQYKVLSGNEAVHGEAKALLDRCSGSWTLTPYENVYYILSGYAHSTLQAIRNAPPKPPKNGDDALQNPEELEEGGSDNDE